MPEPKPHIKRIVLSRHRVRWVIFVGEYILGFKKQRQFKTFGCACFLAGCLKDNEVPHA